MRAQRGLGSLFARGDGDGFRHVLTHEACQAAHESGGFGGFDDQGHRRGPGEVLRLAGEDRIVGPGRGLAFALSGVSWVHGVLA